MRLRHASAVFLAALGLTLGCNAILGIEARHLSDEGAGGGPDGVSGGCLPDATDIRTGVIQVDGLLDAADAMADKYVQVEEDFHSRMLVIAAALSLDTSAGYSSQLVDDVVAALSTDVAAYSANGVAVFIDEVSCRADVDAALEQENRCEKLAGCASGESTAVECSGLCVGDCAGDCDECRRGSTGACDGNCIGDCEPDVPGACSGLCAGPCNGSCTEKSQGDCEGGCDGECQGTCQYFEATACAGACNGTCVRDSTGPCSAGSTCAGHCEAECDGDCIGSAVPVPGDPDCEFADTCRLQASLMGAAHTSCDAPGVTATYEIDGSVPPGEAAQFRARLDGIVASAPPLLVGLGWLEIIAAGQLVGVQLTSTPPYTDLSDALKDISGRAARGQPIGGVPEGCEADVAPFVDPVLENVIALNMRGTLLAGDELKFVFALQAGFN